MAQLAIRGHATRGKEVIEILEMLGGKNIHNYVGTSNECYAIDNNKICTIYTSVAKIDNCVIFTLEEFLEKFPYKVGDKVSSKYLKNYKVSKMEWESANNRVIYKLQGMGWYSANELQPYKEETMEKKSKLINIEPKLVGNECVHFPIPTDMKLEVKDGMCYLYRDCGELTKYLDNATPEQLDEALEKETKESLEEFFFGEPQPKAPILSNRYDYADGKCGYVIPAGYEFDYIKEGFQTEIILKPKKPTYPKDFDECCNILGIEDRENGYCGYEYELLGEFQKLYICRNAYWKLAGVEMGLDKPWEPDWMDNLQHKHYISTECDEIKTNFNSTTNKVLAFPTAEMRDAFFENFKELIKKCKELL